MLTLVHSVPPHEDTPCVQCHLGDQVVTSPAGVKHCGRCNVAWKPTERAELRAVN